MSSDDDEGGAWFQVGTDDDADLMQVWLTPELPPGWRCFCRWHEAARWLRRLALRIGWAVQRVLCGLRGHRLTVESRDINGRCFTLYCWCAKRYRYVGDDG